MRADPARISARLEQAFGKVCWSAIASERTDYVIVLDLGEKVRRSMRLANPRLSFLQRTYEGEYSFLVECAWRLDGPKGVITACYDSNEPGGLMHRGLREIEGRSLEGASIQGAAFDLTLAFSGGFSLRCLSTEIDPRSKRNNWSFWSPQGLVSIGPRGRSRTETRAEAERHFAKLKRSLAQDEDDVVSRLGRERGPGASNDPADSRDEGDHD